MSTSSKSVKNVVLAVTGASGACYAQRFLERAAALDGVRIHLLMTDTAREVWHHELDARPVPDRFMLLDNDNYFNPFCSGSAAADVMVVLPCSMGTLARIAAGTADDALARIADVQLKERRPLILVPRETPLSLIHLRNMTALTEAGAIIAPAAPGFYNRPADLPTLVDGFVARILQLAGLTPLEPGYRWDTILTQS
ncbi:MAG: UbiX family flavin prenyltransferase [Bacteroidales bacterium]|nr:UbiX family flavin prenyltransferase [Bacteroidales bacterium]MBR5100202.1 UbiX family flavin prenyltransferase [Bacteroidales bacterium]